MYLLFTAAVQRSSLAKLLSAVLVGTTIRDPGYDFRVSFQGEWARTWERDFRYVSRDPPRAVSFFGLSQGLPKQITKVVGLSLLAP